MGAAVSNTIMGVSIVFFVLVSLSFLIYLFRFISVIEDKLTKKKTQEPVKEEKVQETLPVEEETNLVDDLELIAVITAAIAASEGGDPGQYIVRSIKIVHRNQW